MFQHLGASLGALFTCLLRKPLRDVHHCSDHSRINRKEMKHLQR